MSISTDKLVLHFWLTEGETGGDSSDSFEAVGRSAACGPKTLSLSASDSADSLMWGKGI